MIKQHIEQAIRSIETEKEQAIRLAEQKVMQEKVVPYNASIDEKKDAAVQQLTAKFNTDVQALQEQFAKDKAEVISACENDKAKNQRTVIATESALVSMEYDKAIASLKSSLGDVTD